jgi:hypothetical protein
MRSFWQNRHGNVDMILTGVVMGIVFAVSIAIIYGVVGGLDYTTIDQNLNTALGYTNDQWNNTTSAANASGDLQTNLATFYTLGPIAIVIVAAVGIISYVLLLRR